MKKRIWPKYPYVQLLNDEIVIMFENGKTLVWGVEEDIQERENVMRDIQDGLRAIRFLTDSLKEFFESLLIVLLEKGFTEEQLDEYMLDAIRNFMNERQQSSKQKPVRKDLKTSLSYVHYFIIVRALCGQ